MKELTKLTVTPPPALAAHDLPLDYLPSAEMGSAPLIGMYLQQLRRYASRIVAFVLIFTIAVTLFLLTLPKEYEAIALVRVGDQQAKVVGEQQRESDAAASELQVATEREVATSPQVVNALIDTLRLDSAPEFVKVVKNAPANLSPDQKRDVLVAAVTKRIAVDRPLGTLLLQVGFRSRSPQLAADAANKLAQALLDNEYQTRSDAFSRASRYMNRQADLLRAAMESSQKALVQYESSHDVINPDDRSNIMQARLSQMNQDLSTAESNRMRLQAYEMIVESGNLDALLVTDRGAGLMPLKTRLINDQQKLAAMATIYGARHPLYLQQAEIVAADRAALSGEEKHVAAQVHSEYEAALQRENLVTGALQRQKKDLDAFNLRSVEYASLKGEADSNAKLYYDLLQRVNEANVAANFHSDGLRIVSHADVPSKPVFPKILLLSLLAFVGSTLLACGFTIAIGSLDKSLTSPAQVMQWLSMPVVGELPSSDNRKDPEGLMPLHGMLIEADGGIRRRGQYKEAVLSLHTMLSLTHARSTRVWAITSAVPREGKSTTCANLATAFAEFGSRVVVVDADLRRPNAHRFFDVSNRTGLSSVLQGTAKLEEALVRPSSDGAPTILPSGPAVQGPTELLHAGLAQVIEQLKDQFDHVFIDCPPVLGLAESTFVANLADGVLLVVRAGETSRDLVTGAVRYLVAARANLLGVILNGVDAAMNSYYGYYGSYYGSSDRTSELAVRNS
jgi:succinoglycan biosynthesis transport protein ExoP